MRNIKFKLSAFLLIYVGLPSLIYALSQHSMVPANSIILNLDQAISTTISNSKFTKIFSENILPSKQFIAFPKEIPFNSGKLYASASQHTNGLYVIEVSSQKGCTAKPCIKAYLQIVSQENPVIYYDRDNRIQTSWVKLHSGVQGFYTNGFAMADFWPSNIQWRDREALYKLMWQDASKQDLILMANSVIDQLQK